MLVVAVVLVDNHNFAVLNKLIGNDLISASFLNCYLFGYKWLNLVGLTLLLSICRWWFVFFFFQDYPLESNLWKHHAIILDVDAMFIAHEVLFDPCLTETPIYIW